ncbi:hypothetical protein BVC80_1835g131 [Macleaya cordata]|uniref:Uncharacterized protein n=1 Tax=Macleaya cordata TaxID=56857 RepID=A0A200R4Y1_MACCD|nr:hypothetical protein BVC80_1835g131 [Macleaya cordata]
MEGGGKGKPSKPSSSSISSDLFGTKGSSSSPFNANPSSSSSGIFDSVFSTPSTILGRESSRSGVIGSWNSKQESPGSTKQSSEGENRSMHNKDRSSIYQDERTEPCYLSSSLYYGGQDMYSDPSNTRTSGQPHIFKKDDGEDDENGSNLNSASRGNWWQGMTAVEE